MDIRAIARHVEENIREGGAFTFRDDTVGVPYIMLLFHARMRSADSFELNGLFYSLEKDVFRMKGSGTFPDGGSYELEVVFYQDESGILQVEMPGEVIMPEFAGTAFLSRSAYYEQEGAWKIRLLDTGFIGLGNLLSGAISFLGISVPATVFGDVGKISGLSFQYELPFAETGDSFLSLQEENGFADYNGQKYMSLSFRTDMVLSLSSVFAKGNQVALLADLFLVEKFGGIYGFGFEGRIRIWDFQLPFHIRYDGWSWTLDTFGEDTSMCMFPSINRLGEIVGIGNLHLPESFSNLSNFTCEGIALAAASDFQELLSFRVVVSNQNAWYLSREPDIHITNIRAGFAKNGTDYMVFISGDFILADWKLTLAGSYDGEEGWIFRSFLSCMDMASANISEIFRKLCSFAGVGEIPFPLPDFPFKGAGITYYMKTRTFSAKMQIGRLQGEFVYAFLPETKWQANLAIDAVFDLSALPLVGSGLHLLDGVVIRDIYLRASQAGSVLHLDFAGEEMLLQLSGKGKRDRQAVGAENVMDAMQNFLWFSLEKRFSVFTIHRLGIGFRDKRISFAFDAELAANAFEISLTGLAAEIAVSEKSAVSFRLAGLTVGYHHPSLQISGGFRHTVSDKGSSYDGMIRIAVKKLSVFAVGTYADNSFLAYGILRTKLGGPPAFSVTGLAVGAGFHKYLALPAISQVAVHPLVEAAVNPHFSEGQLLDGLHKKVSTMPGQNFLAAGVSFLSFGMVSSFALLTVSFGQHLEVALLGISKMTVPPMTEKEPIARAELALKAAFIPEAGVFSAEAQLMPASYILSSKCKLTGGFAFYLWFGGEQEGDFVITLGGYRRGYRKPVHYPDVPRLGFCWNVTPELELSGEMYFALTPAALCAGGKLDAVFTMGALRAWFTAYADFEIGWKPFYYDISIGIGIGFSITLDCWLFSKTFTMEMSADLHIWGPAFSGVAKIKWWIISFTISFGAKAERIEQIDWDEFKKSFLDKEIASVCAIDGVIGKRIEEKEGKKVEIEVVRADTFQLGVESLIPITSACLKGAPAVENVNGTEVGVLPMGEGVRLSSELVIEVTYGRFSSLSALSLEEMATDPQGQDDANEYVMEEIRRNVPKAMWGQRKKGANAGESELIENVLSGMCIRMNSQNDSMFPANHFLTIAMLAEFQEIIKTYVPVSVWKTETVGRDSGFCIFKEEAPKMPQKAGALAKEMEKFGFTFDFAIDVSIMADNAESLFDEEFVLI